MVCGDAARVARRKHESCGEGERVGGRRGSVQPSGKTQHVVVRRREGGGAVTMRFSLCETEERWTRRLIKAVASFRSSFVNLDPAQ